MNSQSFGDFRGPSKPTEVGQEYDVDIKEMSYRGDCMARIEGFVVCIPNTQNGDHVKIRLTRVSRRFGEAEAVSKEAAEEKEENEE